MKRLYKLILTLSILLMSGCATVPSLRVPQPWIRTLQSDQLINPTKKVKVEVIGKTYPLLGNEELTSEKIKSFLTQLLRRRGFDIGNDGYEYLVKLYYKTDRKDKMNFASASSTTNSAAYGITTNTGIGVTSGLGVSIARAIGFLASQSSTENIQSAEQIISFNHTIAIELSNKDGVILWKGESTWDTGELDLIKGIIPAMQLILSDLPSDMTIRPEVSEVKESHVKNYYRIECKDVWFTCPALPYRILFNENAYPSKKISIPSGIYNRNAFAAYVDLIQTAEYALPDGDENDWSDPLEVSLWEKVTLGGQYLLGPDKLPVDILIKLYGRSDGYYVEECKIATRQEYSDFNHKLMKWRQMLADYYNFYKK